MAALSIDYQPLTTIKLYGVLRQFGREFKLSVRTPAEAVKALCVQIPGFERFISNAKSRGMEFAVFRGSKTLRRRSLAMVVTEIFALLQSSRGVSGPVCSKQLLG